MIMRYINQTFIKINSLIIGKKKKKKKEKKERKCFESTGK